jgi:invasion protein IalB
MGKQGRLRVAGALLALWWSVPCLAQTSAILDQYHGWWVQCQRDAMTDQVRCMASQRGIVVMLSGPTKHPSVGVGGTGGLQYPDTTCYMRIDTAPARQKQDSCHWSGAEATAVITHMLRGQTLRTRYSAWPYDNPVEMTIDLAGFADVWAKLQAAYAAQ